MPRRYYVRTFGCQMNEHDSAHISSLLDQDGLEGCDDPTQADVIVLNTCCIRENADNKLYGHLGHLKTLKDANPELQIAVGGCLAQKDREVILKRAPWVDAVWGTHNTGRAVELLAQARLTGGRVIEVLDGTDGAEPEFPSALPVRRDAAWSAWVTIQIGCDNNCAFCIVPSVRGSESSRPFGQLVEEVAVLAASGTVEVTLLGQNVNSYGRDLTTRLRTSSDWAAAAALAGAEWTAADRPRARPLFADLLRAVGRIDGIRRVRFTSPHPKDLRPETIEAMATEAVVCPHLHLPLQSGSDRVLAAMHRGYTAARYLERLGAARAAIDDLAVTTDIIVGFPGETDDDFERTLEVVAAAEYDSAYTFIYSPRPGTEAAGWTPTGSVPPEAIAEQLRTAPGGRGTVRPGQAPGPDRPGRGGPDRGALQARSRYYQRPDRAGQAGAPERRTGDPGRRNVGRRAHHEGSPSFPGGSPGGGHRSAPPPHPPTRGGRLNHPGPGRLYRLRQVVGRPRGGPAAG